ncbi:MAG: hypothetical protein HOL85_21715 [Rhodospirillaceae bacterium]|mgnify:FL=1|jgi:hypothetical protein|nr:hypothetical protein [Rhodospirillaceae bacterium]MBT6136184.1 hypothetical protein [Rhodospirillaceae bacterium]
MLAVFKKPPRIHGQIVPGRRPTGWAAIYFAAFVALPILGLTLGLDLIGWLVATKLFDASCYGVTCFFG